MSPSQSQTRKVQDGLGLIAQKIKAGDASGALADLLPILQSPNANAQVFEYAILCYEALRDDKTARALSDAAIARFPEDPWLWTQNGKLAMAQGNTTAAENAFRTAIGHAPRHLPALAALPLVAPVARGDKIDKKLRRAMKSSQATRLEVASGHHAVATIEAAAGFHARAFHHYAQCNRLRNTGYDPTRDAALVNGQIAQFEPNPAVDMPARYAFIGGMPRSGTTLLETALRQHPQIDSIGETTALLRLQQKAEQMAEDPSNRWAWFSRLSDAQRDELRGELVETLETARDSGQVVLEKLPLNCLHFGFAHVLLPEARFIFMSRHPLDCGLSNFATNFEQGQNFSTRLDWIAAKLRATERSAQDYAQKLGWLYRTQSYRALVESPKTQLAALLQHLGLPWHDAVLSPHTDTSAQRTASMLQVRKAIHRNSLGRWTEYEPQLRPLLDALGGPDWLAEWEARDAQNG